MAFDPFAPVKKPGDTTAPPATAPAFDPFSPLRAKDNAPPPPPPPVPGTVGGALKEAAHAADNYMRAYADDWTYGGLDAALGGDERQKTIQAKDELGTGGRLAAGTMAALTNPVTAAIKTGGLIKSTLVGAGQGAADAAGHGGSLSDVFWGAGTGAAVGSGLHAVGLTAAEAARRLAETKAGKYLANTTVGQKIRTALGANPASITAGADADQQAAFRNLDNFRFDPNDTLAGAQGVQAQLFGGTNPRWVETQAGSTAGILRRYVDDMRMAQRGAQTAGGNSLHSVVRALNKVIAGGGPTEDVAAATQARDSLLQMTNRLTPLNGSTGAFNTALSVANDAHGTYKNALMLENMKSKLDERGAMPGGEARTILDDPNKKGFYNPDQKSALTDISKTGTGTVGAFGGPESLILPGVGGAFGAAHGFGPLATGVGIGGTLSAVRNLSTKAGARQAVADAYPAMTGDFMSNPEQQALRAMKYIGLGSLSGDNGTPIPNQYKNNPFSGFINDALPEEWR